MRPSKFKQNPDSEHDYYFSAAALRACLGAKAERRKFCQPPMIAHGFFSIFPWPNLTGRGVMFNVMICG